MIGHSFILQPYAYLHNEPCLIVLGLLRGSSAIYSVEIWEIWMTGEITKNTIFLHNQRLCFRRELLNLDGDLLISWNIIDMYRAYFRAQIVFFWLQIIIFLCCYIFEFWLVLTITIFSLHTGLLINPFVHVAVYSDADAILQRVSFSWILNAIQSFKNHRSCVLVLTPIFDFPFISIIIVSIVTSFSFPVTKIIHLADRQVSEMCGVCSSRNVSIYRFSGKIDEILLMY